MATTALSGLQVDSDLAAFINDRALPGTGVSDRTARPMSERP